MSEMGEILFGSKEAPYFGRRSEGLLAGVVSKNYDEKLPGQVEIELPIGESSKTMKVWADCIGLSAGGSYGLYQRPEVGDVAVIAFIEGNTSRPIVLGYLYKKGSELVKSCFNEKNTLKKYKTLVGSEVIFESKEKKECITLTTKTKQQIILDEESEEIRLLTAEGKNNLKLQGKEGIISLEGAESISLKVGESKLILKKDGTIEMDCKTLKVAGKPNVKIDGNSIEASGTQLNMKGTAGVKVESSAIIQVKGQMVKLG